MKAAWCVGLLLGFAGCSGLGSPATPASGQNGEPLVPYCSLVSSPGTYAGQEVRVVGVYRTGFEWSQLYSLQCPDAGSAWVEWNGYHRCSEDPRPKELIFPASEGTFGLVARGKLEGGQGGFGHLGAYNFQLTIDCVERIQILDERSYHPGALTPDMRRKIEKFEKQYG